MRVFARPQNGIFDSNIARFRLADNRFAVKNRVFYNFAFCFGFDAYFFIIAADNGFDYNVLYAVFRQRINDNVAVNTREIIKIVVYNLFIFGKIGFFAVDPEISYGRAFAEFVAGFQHSHR